MGFPQIWTSTSGSTTRFWTQRPWFEVQHGAIILAHMDLLRGIFMTLVTKRDQIHPKEKAWYPLIIKHWKIHHLVSWFPHLKDVKKAISSRFLQPCLMYIYTHIILYIYICIDMDQGLRTKGLTPNIGWIEDQRLPVSLVHWCSLTSREAPNKTTLLQIDWRLKDLENGIRSHENLGFQDP